MYSRQWQYFAPGSIICYIYRGTGVASVKLVEPSMYILIQYRFNSFGIYVVMFLEILQTLVRVLFVFSVLIIAFGLSFYILMAKIEVCTYTEMVNLCALNTQCTAILGTK